MDIKYYYYISESKVQMLLEQFKGNNKILGFNPKVEIAGVSLGFDYKAEDNRHSSLISQTSALLLKLKKHKLIGNPRADKPQNIFMIHDIGNWRHGLVSIAFRGESERIRTREITYVAWTKRGRDIYLLVGSPANILGNKKFIEATHTSYISTDMWLKDMQMMKISSWSTFIEAMDELQNNPLIRGESFWIDVTNSSRYPLSDKHHEVGDTELWCHRSQANLAQGKALLMFCKHTLTSLSLSKLDAMFKIFNEFPVASEGIDTLYLGSPLYTAIS